MGILNVTPDSFSDGGRFPRSDDAVAEGLRLLEQGADLLDVGGESTRPSGAARIDADEEVRRVAPVIEGLRRRSDALISVDTTKAKVAAAALDAGADIVNDVSALSFDPELGPLVARRGAAVVLMHLRGDFEAMHGEHRYGDVFGEVASELLAAAARAERAGIPRNALVLDPGIGFAKDAPQSLALLRSLPAFAALDRPLLVGPSRKRFIGHVLDLPVGERLFGTAAAVGACVLGGAHIVRVHDVREMVQVARVCDAILDGSTEG